MSYRPVLGKPRLTQDWGDEQHERETHWTSLFYDLMLVAAFNAIAEPFEEAFESGPEEVNENERKRMILMPLRLLGFDALVRFFSILNPWYELNQYTSKFEDESLAGHLVFFVHCFGIAATAAGCVGELSENYVVLGFGIVLARVGLLALWARSVLFLERARVEGLFRCAHLLVTIVVVFAGTLATMRTSNIKESTDGFDRFRTILAVTIVWELLGPLSYMALAKKHRIPIHIMSYSNRIKEATMVVFGEAIFAIVLRPYSDAHKDSNYFFALLPTLWLIYSMALQEFHIMPNDNNHALLRPSSCGSFPLFGYLWYYTQIFKLFCLMGLSIGIKRAHLLALVSPLDPVDEDTLDILVSESFFVLLSVGLIRIYSFGFGLSKDDPPDIYRMKVAWIVIHFASCLFPLLLDQTILEVVTAPLEVLVVFAIMMALIILLEAIITHVTAQRIQKRLMGGTNVRGNDANEMTLLHGTESNGRRFSGSAEFLVVHGPKLSERNTGR